MHVNTCVVRQLTTEKRKMQMVIVCNELSVGCFLCILHVALS